MRISNLGPPRLPDPPDLKKSTSRKLSKPASQAAAAEQQERGFRTFRAGQATTQNVAKPLEANPVGYTPTQIPNVPEGGGKGPNPVAYTPIQLPNVPEAESTPPGPTPPPVMQNAMNFGVQGSAPAQTVQAQGPSQVESSPVPQPVPSPEFGGWVGAAQEALETLPIPLPDQAIPADKPMFTPIPLPDPLDQPSIKHLDLGRELDRLRPETDRNPGAIDPIPLPKQRLGDNKT
jgi:hypothetical protein